MPNCLEYSAFRRCHSNFIASPPTMRPSGWPCQEPVEHVEADVPASRAHRHELATDVVPERETRAGGQRLQLPAHVVLAPAVLEQPRRLGSRDARLGDLRRGRRNGRELHRSRRVEVPIGVERRPLAQLCGIGQRLPDLLRRMTQLSNENERPSVAVLSDLRAGGGARCVLLTSAHRFFPFLGGACVHAIEVAFERVDVGGPKAPEGSEPGVDLHERLGPDPVDAPLRIHSRFHEAGRLGAPGGAWRPRAAACEAGARSR